MMVERCHLFPNGPDAIDPFVHSIVLDLLPEFDSVPDAVMHVAEDVFAGGDIEPKLGPECIYERQLAERLRRYKKTKDLLSSDQLD